MILYNWRRSPRNSETGFLTQYLRQRARVGFFTARELMICPDREAKQSFISLPTLQHHDRTE
ncbi:hypothetical protein [Roseofilum capinflatum]|uniref:Uncharacterized protein n=1 Tax=Roseofilum capinflatum BLCC-M114 TaxID=3022440 RepID=A0ABT7BD46_9CYAN|nr:hypothetical protein [Roseofilum capinflatum]MDJ1177005.1 hypothetical protein [Roseofilum capinflatum BLCC-M114]